MHKPPTDQQLDNRYTHHPPTPNQIPKYEQVRAKICETSKLIRDLTPVCPEQSRAFNALDEAMFLANAAIARNPAHT